MVTDLKSKFYTQLEGVVVKRIKIIERTKTLLNSVG